MLPKKVLQQSRWLILGVDECTFKICTFQSLILTLLTCQPTTVPRGEIPHWKTQWYKPESCLLKHFSLPIAFHWNGVHAVQDRRVSCIGARRSRMEVLSPSDWGPCIFKALQCNGARQGGKLPSVYSQRQCIMIIVIKWLRASSCLSCHYRTCSFVLWGITCGHFEHHEQHGRGVGWDGPMVSMKPIVDYKGGRNTYCGVWKSKERIEWWQQTMGTEAHFQNLKTLPKIQDLNADDKSRPEDNFSGIPMEENLFVPLTVWLMQPFQMVDYNFSLALIWIVQWLTDIINL